MVIECPHCHTHVLPKADNICPACRRNILDTQGVDPNMVSLTVRESQELPPYCYLCNNYTERYILIEGDKESPINRSIRMLGSFLVPHRVRQTDEGTTNVFIHLPQCEACSEREQPTPIYVDYENQSMTFLVHKDFKERVQSIPVENKESEIDENLDNGDTGSPTIYS